MSTTAVSNSSIYQELQSFYQNRQTDLKQLGSALQNGDLSGSQQAFNTLATLGQDGPFANSEPFSKASRSQAFEAIGQDLQNGDLAGAQSAFAALNGQQFTTASTPAAVATLSYAPVGPTAGGGSSIYEQVQAYRQQRTADLAQLGQDLQAGNLTAAQQDVSTLTALGQSGPYGNGQVFQRTDRAQDFQAIGQDLQAGDLAGAQSAFASLSATFGGKNYQSQSAISAYNSGAAPNFIKFIPPPTSSTGGGSTTVAPPTLVPPTTPPGVQGPPTGPPVVLGPPSSSTGSGVNQLVINLGGPDPAIR